MDLKTFVNTSLTQILDGIREAQKQPGGGNIAAEGYISGQGNLMSGGTSGFFTLVEFDVQILAGTKDGQPNVTVAGIEVSNKNESTHQNSSRVKFSVHVRLPQGGANRDVQSHRESYSTVTDYDPYND